MERMIIHVLINRKVGVLLQRHQGGCSNCGCISTSVGSADGGGGTNCCISLKTSSKSGGKWMGANPTRDGDFSEGEIPEPGESIWRQESAAERV
ncbi:hypothetical protein SESBI_12510 [Sesbania bispinosa]|nr:hypothetical protein SESBI_12510 [Sesbania bispinosa]